MSETKVSPLIPLGDRVVIERLPADNVTAGGIHLPDAQKDKKPSRGTIIAIGSEAVHGDISLGDVVIFSAYAGENVKANSDELVVISVKDIIAKLAK